MIKWSLNEAKPGDILRVKINKSYYHFGLYIGNDLVIEYGSKNDVFNKEAKDVVIQKVSIKEFSGGSFIEKREYSLLEKMKRNKPEKAIMLAKERLGEMKYDILENNCEHFVNECVFNKHISLQSEEYKKSLK